MTSYAERLVAMDNTYDSAEAKTSSRVPDGDYIGQIEHFGFWDDNGQKPLKLVTEVSVADGEYAGRKVPSIWHELEDPDRIGYTKGYLHLLGLEGVRLSQIESALEPVVGTRVEIRVATTKRDGNEYRNTYINDVIGKSEFAAAAPAEEDDIPF